MRSSSFLVTLALVASSGVAIAAPSRDGITGIGINNTPSVIGIASGVAPALSLKHFFDENNALTVDFGFVAIGGGASGHFVVGGLGYERTLHSFEEGHFFFRLPVHVANGDGLSVASYKGGGTAFNVGLYVGFEHIFDKGLPGLGIGAEYGINGLVLLPKEGDTTFVFSGGGFGPGASFENLLLLSIRYYFLGASEAKPARSNEATVGAEAPAEPRVERAPAPPTDALDLWDAVADADSDSAACDQVFDVLSKDEACEGEQCRGPRGLSAVYLQRCAKFARDKAQTIQRLHERWMQQAPGDIGSRCYQALLRSARSKDAARNYTSVCLNSRKAGYLESILIGEKPAAKVEPKAEPSTQDAKPKDPAAQEPGSKEKEKEKEPSAAPH